MASGLARTAPENPEKSRQTRLTAVNFHKSAPDAHLRLDEGDIYGRGADKKRFAPTATLTDAALADSTPLHQTISHYFDDNMLARIAAGIRERSAALHPDDRSRRGSSSAGKSEATKRAAIQAR